MAQVAAVPYDPAKELELLRAENERLSLANKTMKSLIDRRRLEGNTASDEQIIWLITMRLAALRDQVADAEERVNVCRESRDDAVQQAKDKLRKEMAALRKRIGDKDVAIARNLRIRRGLMRGIANLCSKRRRDWKRLVGAVDMAILILRNEAGSPAWDNAPDHRATLLRWCQEIYQEAGLRDPDAR